LVCIKKMPRYYGVLRALYLDEMYHGEVTCVCPRETFSNALKGV
jgi:hypothetical protein